MPLAITYCKELLHELRLIPVYVPGTEVSTGDVINFIDGNIFSNKPIGSFRKVTELKELGIDLETESNNNSHSYVFASKHSVNASFTAAADGATQGKGSLSIKFQKAGSIYLSALECSQTRYKDLRLLEGNLTAQRQAVDWKNCFIVVGVTVAAKALIMQSNSSSATMVIEGNVKGLQPAPGASVLSKAEINANLDLQISSYTDASFIKPWSENVAVFFQLVRYKKSFFGDWDIKNTRQSELLTQGSDLYQLEVVSPADALSD